jgi:hypothetical protein
LTDFKNSKLNIFLIYFVCCHKNTLSD